MEKTLCSSNLYSHPDKLLEDHLIGVSRLASLFLSEKPQNIRNELTDISRIIALTHDLGKASGYFQKYLFADEKEKYRLKGSKEVRHSFLSSLCVYYITKEIKPESLYPFFAFLTVRRHHGNLRDVLNEVSDFDDKDAELLRKQLESTNNDNFYALANKLHKAGLPVLLNKNNIDRWINDFGKEMKVVKKQIKEIDGNVRSFITINLLYSLLLDADKSDVVIKDTSAFERKQIITGNLVDNYKAKTSFPQSPINDIRDKAYQEVMGNNITTNKKIYSLNLPTGLGKTLAAFSFALKLKERLKKDNVNPRIIYALPFLSIIDQNSNVFESVIKANDIKPDSDVFLKHHHLSEIFYKKEDIEFEPDEAKILIEGWNSEIIVTTFIQLFHTLISNKNRSIRKFHRLANSIIILDEIQSIPIKYWLLLKTVLKELSESLNVYIIFATATEPLIFDREETQSLVNRDFYFNSLDRVSLISHLSRAMTLNEIYDYFKLTDGKSYLFIFNTIGAAKDFYNLIKDTEIPKTYLSTYLTPKDRLERIKDIKNGSYKIVVSTQLVEAGVDIDFDVVVRDIAPLDSINQASGRCNRNGNKKGNVHIVILEDANDKKYASYIYDSVLLDITQRILSNKDEIKEGEFLQLIESYYMETKEKKTQEVSKNLLEAITKLRYDSEDDKTSISEFKLIEESYQKTDVFIELDEEAKEVWKQYAGLKNIDGIFLRKQKFDSIKADFYQYVISIPSNVKNMPEMFGEIGYVKQSILADYYDSETGFIAKDTKSVIIW
ncbi:MAG: CRISPR-associated helicase Cas3' [bacterium]